MALTCAKAFTLVSKQAANTTFTTFFISTIQVEGLSGEDMELLKRVVDNAKKYYANPKSYDAAWQEEDNEDEQ
ncbi:hypothetical protein [Nitrosomonas communis]|uniref:hypothetical protein n=1 Tax=Nitrosomonas communis TaxID=44574 RepID=UPI0009454699|nr:hypothetical protein [Nitrosomonas communis]